MGSPWAADFSYPYLRRLLTAAAERFEVRPLAEALEPVRERPVLVLRHDVDVSLHAAVRVAELEAELGVRASYLAMLDWPLYEAEGTAGRAALHRLRELGHDLGLHVDPRGLPEEELPSLRDRLGAAAGAPVRSLSFHRPPPGRLRGPERIAGMVNAYGAPLMRTYLSDSKGRFAAGDPLRVLSAVPGPLVQVLIHPVWWGERHAHPRQRLRALAGELDPKALAAAVPAVPFR
jgi:hypothetical protein